MKKIFQMRTMSQVVLASVVTILVVAGIVGATTIGTNISTYGTLSVGGAFTATSTASISGQLDFANASSTGWLKVATINSDTGAISFGDENLTTTGTLGAGAITGTSLTDGTATLNSGALSGVTTLDMSGLLSFVNASSTGTLKVAAINSDTGAISFGDENLTTTGSLQGGVLTDGTASISSGAISGLTTLGMSGLLTAGAGFISGASSTVVGNLTVTGDLIQNSTTLTANDLQVGGGYGSTGLTINDQGAIYANASTTIDGVLTVGSGLTVSAGQLNFVTASSTGTLKVATINSDTGAISFGDENLTTTGSLQGGTLTDGTATLNSGAFSGITTLGMSGLLTAGGGFISTGSSTVAGDFTSSSRIYGSSLGIMNDAIIGDLTISSSTYATSTLAVGNNGASAACLKLQDTDLAGWTYCTVLDGTMTCGTTSCE